MPTTSTRAGRWVRQQAGAEGFSAFVPAALPPSPPLEFTPELQRLNEAAGRALGRLEGVSASLEVLKTLGWTVVAAAEEVFGAAGTLGRETPGDTVLLPRLEAALRSLNPALPPEAISGAVHALTRDRSVLSLVAANREVWELLRCARR